MFYLPPDSTIEFNRMVKHLAENVNNNIFSSCDQRILFDTSYAFSLLLCEFKALPRQAKELINIKRDKIRGQNSAAERKTNEIFRRNKKRGAK